MQSTPSKAKVQQQGLKEKKSNYWPFLCGVLGCITLPAVLLVGGFFAYAFVSSDGGEVGRLLRQVEGGKRRKAREDLQLIRNAINLYEGYHAARMKGTELKPLLGRFLGELPMDPWGNRYLLDSSVGLVVTYGADALPGGTDADEDLVERYLPPLTIQRVQYEGPWGRPCERNLLRVTMNKPFDLVDEDELLKSLVLLKNRRIHKDGMPESFASLNEHHGHLWKLDKEKSKPYDIGLLVLQNHSKVSSQSQSVTPTMALNFSSEMATKKFEQGDDNLVRFGIRERWLANGPLDSAIYGKDTRDYLNPPEAVPLRDGENRGIRIERY